MKVVFLILFNLFSILSFAQEQRKTMKAAAAKHQIKIGSSFAGVAFRKNDEEYKKIVANELNMLTPENQFKYGHIRPRRDVWNFDLTDQMVEFAKQNSMVVRGHCFDWHLSNPVWLEKGAFTSFELEAYLKEFIEKTMKRYKEKYPGVVQYWDVANESIDDNAQPRKSIWSKIGREPNDHIEFAFKTANLADPDVKLFYNDYGIEELNAKSNAVYEMIKAMKEKGVPIHGIGFQMHLVGILKYDFESMAKNFERFRKLGLIIHITELNNKLDLNGRISGPTTKQLDVQAQNLANVAKLCINEPACSAIVHWNLTDKYYDEEDGYKGWGSPAIFNHDLKEKPSFFEFLKAFDVEPKK